MSNTTKRLFPLPQDHLGAAKSWIDHGERTPRKPRLASSVVLVRDSVQGLETYLTYRPGESPLGTVAFPGGSVEPGDDDPVGWIGPSPAKWAQLLGVDDHQVARRHVLAAIRETFEEAGVLLAGPDEVTLVESTRGDEWMREREAVASQEQSFSEILARRGLSVRTDLIKPISHWLSPDFAHRRFDSWYFVAAVPMNQTASLLRSKGIWGQWEPAAATYGQRSSAALGDAIDVVNTRGLTLSQLTVPGAELILERLAVARNCIAYLSHKRPLPIHKPQLVVRDGEFWLEAEVNTFSEGAPSRER